uniref:NADH dehydrogenase [ubiquinone] iron-sulfur protein 4, mitochondrial n=1 Tax=Romanomermis culicivorax TaxID=13658 RepID=A0A915HHF6_ROMCU
HFTTPKSDGSSGDEKFALSSDSTSTAVKTYENLRHDKIGNPSAVAESAPYYFPENVDVPLHTTGRRARIFVPARAATQAGVNNTKSWAVELDNRERWESPLMGWCASGDPVSNIGMSLKFANKEDAIAFCERKTFDYEVEEPRIAQIKPKSYGTNFSWTKKTRVTTK